MARSSSGIIVAGLTAAALAAVGFLAYQASASEDAHPLKSRPGSSASASADASDAAKAKKRELALPADSGSGERVVYALRAKRVWLVGANELPIRTYKVAPSTVSPPPGTYKVTSRSGNITGSDGVPIEHVVRFHAQDGVAFGFSSAVDGSTPAPGARKKTGGIREKQADGTALWTFATIDTKVVVIP
ncbi:hypothetical protein [Streptomyces sp. H27-D2]|uniref:hypothetical protein n=1 Tax=Streptomyces sp. H27-D2 TaxID=3046304 RepID=UPI002DBD3266|nr:hypothetical protein [Streptomyces sp. H27-D2]MEC4017434.1 hypothetical protein [Streptomyces sp. H27-D2]